MSTPETEAPKPPIKIQVSRSRPSFPCHCGRVLGPNDGHRVFRQARSNGQDIYVFTCPLCRTEFVVETRERLTVAEEPRGGGRNARCPCLSGRKAKRCHPNGFVPAPGAHDKR